jgi:trehalose/maltose hydrolase-like predicted phosphorylase
MNLRDRFAPTDDGFQIVEERFQPEFLPAHESVFAVANGYLGVRGAPEEGAPSRDAGVALNGFYETGRSSIPKTRTGLLAQGRRSSARPTALSSACSWTTSPSSSRARAFSDSSECWTCAQEC